MTIPTVLRNLGNLCNGSTPLGLVLGLVGRGRFRRRGSLVVVDGVRLPLVDAAACTVGSVVLVPERSLEEAEARIPTLLAHEEEHAWQYAYCLGLPFLPLYGLATLWSLWRTGHRAHGNAFEVQAGLTSGGYRPTAA